MTETRPDVYRELRSPSQIKAFADPLRIRIVHVLADHQATNQQVATELGEPPARVFHHLHVLLDAGLIELVETRVSGRNVEKFYRAIARNFILRPAGEVLPETRIAAISAELDRVRHETLESAVAWGDEPPQILRQAARLHPDQLAAFRDRLRALIREFWSAPTGENSESPRTVLTVVTFREPQDSYAEPRKRVSGWPDE